MVISRSTITIADITVTVARKDIKRLRLVVSPPDGLVTVSAPRRMSDALIHAELLAKLPWIQKHRSRFQRQPRVAPLRYISGEQHYYQGQAYGLQLLERPGKHQLFMGADGNMVLSVKAGTDEQGRARVLNNWYRQQLKNHIPPLLQKWQPIVGKSVQDWGVKNMKTRWGSCNIAAKRIWLSLELAKKPPVCLEYVLVHELVHLHERYHNHNFKRLMDTFLPDWRGSEVTLNCGDGRAQGL